MEGQGLVEAEVLFDVLLENRLLVCYVIEGKVVAYELVVENITVHQLVGIHDLVGILELVEEFHKLFDLVEVDMVHQK